MQVEDAGKSECPAVMVGIGVPTLPYPKGKPTSYAGVTERYVEVNLNGGSVYNE